MPNPDRALFWYTVHPTTLTHCWQAWKVGAEMAEAGWIRPMADHTAYRELCQIIADQVTLGSAEDIVPLLTTRN